MPGGGGAEGNRTPDLLIANEALSQLSYSPALQAADNAQGTLCASRAWVCIGGNCGRGTCPSLSAHALAFLRMSD